MKLVIGNKNYSTWSLRPWLLLDAFAVDFTEVPVSLHHQDLTERLSEYSAVARVPVLIRDDTTIWDSLAICEYVSEQYLDGGGWPHDASDRAIARALCAEMHSGFAALRNELPMNIRARRKVTLSDAAIQDIQRINTIWSQYARPNTAGDIRLFGQFSIADCFFAPVVMRLTTYLEHSQGIELSALALDYFASMQAHPSLKKWISEALLETEVVVEDEAGIEV